jgi:1-acyl-sn-glycerol-3-phosphate acyltransferase
MAKKRVRGALKGIHRRNWIYYWVYPYVRMFFFHYYGKVEVKGRKNIPRKAPVIFAPNHQNALMDALIILFSAPGDVVFLARADIFKKKFLAYLMNSFKILPVFRQRDGASELGKNEDIFDISVDVLKHKHNLCVMPEGNHGHHRKLRTIVKGIFRIAFKAQEESGTEPFVKIVPVGLDFGHYVKQNATLFINYGKPIEMSEYWEQYQENAARGINAVKSRLKDELSPLMIDIQDDEHYEAIYTIKGIYNEAMRKTLGIRGTRLSQRFEADKEFISRIEALTKTGTEAEKAGVDELSRLAEEYKSGLEKLKVRDWVVAKRGYTFIKTLWRCFWLMLTFPLFLYGFINNAIPYLVPVRMVRKIKDRQFRSSVKAGLAIGFMFPLMHGLQTLLVGIFTGPWWIWVAYMATVFLTGKFALAWYIDWKKTMRGSWFRSQLHRSKTKAWRLVELRSLIIQETWKLIGY